MATADQQNTAPVGILLIHAGIAEPPAPEQLRTLNLAAEPAIILGMTVLLDGFAREFGHNDPNHEGFGFHIVAGDHDSRGPRRRRGPPAAAGSPAAGSPAGSPPAGSLAGASPAVASPRLCLVFPHAWVLVALGFAEPEALAPAAWSPSQRGQRSGIARRVSAVGSRKPSAWAPRPYWEDPVDRATARQAQGRHQTGRQDSPNHLCAFMLASRTDGFPPAAVITAADSGPGSRTFLLRTFRARLVLKILSAWSGVFLRIFLEKAIVWGIASRDPRTRSPQRVAAVDDQDRPGHVAGRVAGQVDGQRPESRPARRGGPSG